MHLKKLNRLIFTKENLNNDYVSWDKEKEPTSPRYEYEELTEIEYRRIIKAKTQLDIRVYEAILEYVNDEMMCNCDEGMFPRRDLLMGNYYVSQESYRLCQNDLIQGSVCTHLTEMFCGGVVTTPVEQDYLGLEVWFDLMNDGSIEIIAIDSSSI